LSPNRPIHTTGATAREPAVLRDHVQEPVLIELFWSLTNVSIERTIKKLIYDRRRANVPKIDRLSGEGFASHGQDEYIANQLLPNVERGVFIEIGANDGVSLSNTYYLEKRGWSGVVIEPLPNAFKKLEEARRCMKVNACICNYDGETTFLEINGGCEMLSGIPENYDSGHVRRVRKNLKRHNATSREIVVPCFTLKTVLDMHGINHVNYLSIDTEGGELDILRSIDFQEISVDVVSVENNYFNATIENMMQANGYKLMTIAGVDEIYQKQEAALAAA